MKLKTDLSWNTERRKVADLILFENNPRKLTKENAKKLLESLTRFNLVEIPAIDQNNRILAGNMRVACLKELGYNDSEIEVRVPSRPLTEDECKEYLLRSNKNTGDWDYDLLSTFDQELLEFVGFDKYEIAKTFQDEEILYTKKLATPIYEPKGLRVTIADCYDDAQLNSLLKEIESVKDLPEEIKKFLMLAAHRHIKFNYTNIAEYYAQCDNPVIRKLFIDSALVIIDFDSAIERGWVQMHQDILEQIKYEEDGEE